MAFLSWLGVFLTFCVLVCEAQGVEAATSIPWYVWVIVAVVFIVATILIAGGLFYIIRNFRRLCPSDPTPEGEATRAPMPKKKAKKPSVKPEVARDNVDAPLQPLQMMRNTRSNLDLELPRSMVKLQKQLCIGEFGPIYDAEVELQRNVATRALVKVFQQGTTQDLARFREDIEPLMRFEHPHVGKLLGMVSHLPYWAVLELTVNGDLKTFLMNASTLVTGTRPLLGVPQLVAMATDVASGMTYLEYLQYVHKDVAARNCIVTQNLTVKITDFKISRYLFRSEYAVQVDGSLMPLRWMAPESLLDNVFNSSTDIWSFGILLWEVMSRGSFPYPELGDGEVVSAVCSQQYILMKPLDCPDAIYQLMLCCWNGNPRGRFSMTTIHQQLMANIFTMNYPYPN